MRDSQNPPKVLIIGASCVVLAGALWALFARDLHGAGHAPSRVLPPFEPEGYYQAQTWFITPALLGLWGVLSFVAHRLTGGSRSGSFARLAGWLGVVYGLALVVAFVGPEWLLYRRGGVDALRAAVRFTAPALAALTWLGATLVLWRVRGASPSRATAAALAALLVQAALGAPFLR